MEDKFDKSKILVKKPSFYPLRINPAPSKFLDANNKEFGNVIAEKFVSDTEVDPSTMTKKDQKAFIKNLAFSKALLDSVLISQQYLHLHGAHLAKIDQNGSRTNFERIVDKDFKNYNTLLQHGIAGATLADEDRKKKKFIENDNDDYALNVSGQNPHNFNPYFGFSSNLPFKKGSQLFKDFQKSPLYQFFDSNFFSPLRNLGQTMWDQNQTHIQSAQEKAVNHKDQTDPFGDNDTTTFDINSGFKSVINNSLVWQEFTIEESFHFLLNRHERSKQYNTILRSVVGKHSEQLENIKLYEEQNNNPNNSQFENSKQLLDEVLSLSFNMVADFESFSEEELAENLVSIEKVLNENYKKIDESLNFIEKNKNSFTEDELNEYKDIQNEHNELLTALSPYKINLEKNLEATRNTTPNQWIESVGNNLDQLPFYFMYNILFETAPLVSEEMNLGFKDEDTHKTSFQNQMIEHYIEYLNTHHFDSYDNDTVVKATDLMIDNVNYGEKLLQVLKSTGYLTAQGHINSEKFTLETTELNINVSTAEKTRIRQVLHQILLGSFNFDKIDQLSINEENRENIKIITPNNETLYLNDLITNIQNAESPKEQYVALRHSYSIFMDMYESMTQLSTTKEGKNTPKIKEKNDQFELTIYPKSEWTQLTTEKDIDLLSGEEIEKWETVTGEPLVLTSNTKEDLVSFFHSIESLILKLEPIVATFNPENNHIIEKEMLSYQDGEVVSLPLRVIVDNAGQIMNDQIVSPGSQYHKTTIDTLFTQTYFQTNDFNTKSTTTRMMLNKQVGTNIFGKGIINSISRMMHKRDSENYKKEKERATNEKYEEKKAEQKAYNKKLAKRKSDEKKHAQKKQAEHYELQQIMLKMKQLKEKQAAAIKKVNKKKSQLSKKRK